MRVRFLLPGGGITDRVWEVCPRRGERVEMFASIDRAVGVRSYAVKQVHHMLHDTVPADVVVELAHPPE